jgi:hypothetical protein
MKRPTVRKLNEAIEDLEARTLQVAQITGHIVWNTQQIKDVLDTNNDDNGIWKVEITHGFEPGKKCYHIQIIRWPRIPKCK